MFELLMFVEFRMTMLNPKGDTPLPNTRISIEIHIFLQNSNNLLIRVNINQTRYFDWFIVNPNLFKKNSNQSS